MCGIMGYTGTRDAVPIVVDGLKNLEYRGYDSCGIAVVSDDGISIKKDVGRVETLANNGLRGSVAIGHTRWATHGGVTQGNAHPHLSNDGNIVVVHNGIIENHLQLKRELTEKGFTFLSQTDTEIIPNLIQFYAAGMPYIDAVKAALNRLEGSYAVVIARKGEKQLVAARKESPLVLGVAEHGLFIASDIPAFLAQTKKVVYLHDLDMAVVNDKIHVFSLKTGLPAERSIDSIAWDVEAAKKGAFEHFMLKEISEQVDTISNAIEQDKGDIEEVAEAIRKAKGIYLVACGTSYHACKAAEYKFSWIAKRHVNVALASEFPNYKDFLVPESLVIAVSQSGETADVMAAVRAAKEKGAKVIGLVNVVGSSLARESDKAVMIHAGPEICVLSTKAYTNQLAILTLIAYALAGRFEEGKAKLKELIRYVYYLTSATMRAHIMQLASQLRYAQHMYTIGRGMQYPTALEAALKIKEVSYIHAEGFAGGELKHGTIALIEQGTPCLVFTSSDTEKEMISNASELKSRGAYIIGIGPQQNEVFDFFIKVREAEEANSICQIIPMQLLAYQLAVLRGCDPDKPRNLAKSVTVK
ncbi:MAG: glutamine--fructose-6-phosphate transaminase (isomerizing) [archaeon]